MNRDRLALLVVGTALLAAILVGAALLATTAGVGQDASTDRTIEVGATGDAGHVTAGRLGAVVAASGAGIAGRPIEASGPRRVRW